MTNKEVISVNQDKLGKQAIRFMDMGNHEIWVKPLADNELAVCFLNRGDEVWDLDYDWKKETMYFARNINFKRNVYTIRNLWERKTIGTTDQNTTARIPSHGVLMVRISPINNE